MLSHFLTRCESIRKRFGPSAVAHLPLWFLCILTSACAQPHTQPRARTRPLVPAQFALLNDRALAWRIGPHTNDLRGLRLLYDTPHRSLALGIVHWVVRSNHRLEPFDALVLTSAALADARRAGLDGGFFASTLLQESGFDPGALSGAGAVGIGQFTLATADDAGVDPFDWRDAMGGSARLIAGYVDRYRGLYPDPYAVALAAYNAGPGTVAYYRGIPPYPETRGYVADIYDRWARIEFEVAGHRRRGR